MVLLKAEANDFFPVDVKYCRSFFDEFAKKNGFDPLKVRNWYAMDMRQLQKAEVGIPLISSNFFICDIILRFYRVVQK